MFALSLSIVIFGILIYSNLIYKKYSNSIPFYSLFLFEIVWDLLSLTYIENGTYISEQATTSYFIGSTYRFLFILIPFLIIAPIYLSKKLYNTKVECMSKFYFVNVDIRQLNYIVQIFSVLVFLYLIIDLIISGSPLMDSNITRFNFYQYYSTMPLASKVNGLLVNFLVLLNGIIFVDENNSRKNKFMSLIVLFLAILQKVLLDNKFYAIIFILNYFFISKLIGIFEKKISRRSLSIKYIIRISVAIFIFLFIAYYKYSKVYSDPLDRVLSRIFSLQAHTFWGMDKYVTSTYSRININQFFIEIISGIKNISPFDPTIGLGRVMSIISPTIAENFLKDNARFTGGYFTVCIGYLGYFGTFLYSIFIAVIFVLMSQSFYISIKKNEYILLYLNLMVFTNVYDYFRIGNFNYILSLKMIVIYLIIFICNIIRYSKYKSRKN